MICQACDGSGGNARGGECLECDGTGYKCDVCGEACDTGADLCEDCEASRD
jgi:RecJ-like exonuclease